MERLPRPGYNKSSSRSSSDSSSGRNRIRSFRRPFDRPEASGSGRDHDRVSGPNRYKPGLSSHRRWQSSEKNKQQQRRQESFLPGSRRLSTTRRGTSHDKAACSTKTRDDDDEPKTSRHQSGPCTENLEKVGTSREEARGQKRISNSTEMPGDVSKEDLAKEMGLDSDVGIRFSGLKLLQSALEYVEKSDNVNVTISAFKPHVCKGGREPNFPTSCVKDMKATRNQCCVKCSSILVPVEIPPYVKGLLVLGLGLVTTTDGRAVDINKYGILKFVRRAGLQIRQSFRIVVDSGRAEKGEKKVQEPRDNGGDDYAEDGDGDLMKGEKEYIAIFPTVSTIKLSSANAEQVLYIEKGKIQTNSNSNNNNNNNKGTDMKKPKLSIELKLKLCKFLESNMIMITGVNTMTGITCFTTNI